MSEGFFKEEEVSNKGAGDKWDKEERDKALDEYFAGAHPKQLGIKYKNSPKAFKNSILNKLQYNYKKEGQEDKPGRAERYKPFRRISRKGKRFTQNELKFIESHRKLGLDPEITALIVQRDVNEICLNEFKIETAIPQIDFLLAARYAYNVLDKFKIMPNKVYDDLKAEELELGGNKKKFKGDPKDVPCSARMLALYFKEKKEGR